MHSKAPASEFCCVSQQTIYFLPRMSNALAWGLSLAAILAATFQALAGPSITNLRYPFDNPKSLKL